MGKRGPKPAPKELKRKRGNPRKENLGNPEDLVALPAVQEIPNPTRPLAPAGREEWAMIWRTCAAWLAESDVPIVQRYCEAVDDYVIVRGQMLNAQNDPKTRADGSWRLRKQVVDADKRVTVLGSSLGLSPSARAELGVAEVRIAQGVADLMERPVITAASLREDDDPDFIDAESTG